MTDDERTEYALRQMAEQAKEKAIVKVLERIAKALEAIERGLGAIQSTHAPIYDADGKERLP